MPIVRKTRVTEYSNLLRTQSEALLNLLQGAEPNRNIWDQFAISEQDYLSQFTEINPITLVSAIDTLQSTLKQLKKLERHKEAKLHKPK